MEESQNEPQTNKIFLAIVIILLIIGVGYLFFVKNRVPLQENLPVSDSVQNESDAVIVRNTPMMDGKLSRPAGFPQEIPLEEENLVESATTRYPKENAEQLSVSYRSSKTIAEKYSEYKSYLERMSYQITENTAVPAIKGVFGTKGDVNLSVVISNSEGKTLVQLSYLLKSVSL